jgi:hypothetical protein
MIGTLKLAEIVAAGKLALEPELEQARRMKQLEKENARLRRLVTELSLEK